MTFSFNKNKFWSNLFKNNEVDPIFNLNQFWIILKIGPSTKSKTYLSLIL